MPVPEILEFVIAIIQKFFGCSRKSGIGDCDHTEILVLIMDGVNSRNSGDSVQSFATEILEGR